MFSKGFLFTIICCYNVIDQALFSNNFSKEIERHVIRKYADENNVYRPFGSRINFNENFESNYDKIRRLDAENFNYKKRSESNQSTASKENRKNWFYDTTERYDVNKRNNTINFKPSIENAVDDSQNRRSENNLPKKNACIASRVRNSPRCMEKILRKRLYAPSNDTAKTKNVRIYLGTKDKNLWSTISSYVGNVSGKIGNTNNHQTAASFTTNQTISYNNEDGHFNNPLNPCTCYWSSNTCGCDCVGSLNDDDFQRISRSFFPCRNFTFNMTGGQHYALPPNFFSNIKRVDFFNLFISKSTFEYLCDPTPLTSPFKGIKFAITAVVRLQNIYVRRGWNWKPFEQLQSSYVGQVHVVLEGCRLRRLTSDFSHLAGGHVDTINITNSNLEMVGSKAFGTFENMTNFRVPKNKIKDIRRADFPKILPKLVEIDLRNNQLRNLDDDLFKNMPHLKEILLSGNPLIVLSEKTFHDIIGQASLAGISDISLNCDCHLQWLKDDKLAGNAMLKRNMNGAMCRRPSYLRGIPLEYLSKEHLICR